ncbi:MAG TPA: MDR family MFS transporter [Thermomicrobiales bacterium]|nr:MDR family MFS transporter [Thermomicrobiales bacterium]
MAQMTLKREGGVPYKWLVAIAFVIGLFMDLLDTTIVNVALPTLGEHFHTSNTTLEWVITGYLLSLAVWIPASGWLGDRFGTKRIFLFALAMFTIGSSLSGLAWSIDSLIFFRVLQGIGGGMMTPVGTAMLFRAFPPEERAKASAVLTVPIAIAPTIGPILGGWLVDSASWRWIFYINVPIGVLAFLFSLVVLREHTEENPGRLDLGGLFLSGAGLPLALYALSRAPHAGWTSAEVLGTGLGGLALLALFIWQEFRTTDPLLDLRLLNDRIFRVGNAAFFLTMVGMMGVLFLLPLYLQQLRGLSALDSGLTTFPEALGVVVASGPVGKFYPKIGPRRLLAAGLIGTGIFTGLLNFVGLETNLWWIRGAMFLVGLGLGFVFVPVQTAIYATISSEQTGRASSIFNTNRQVASSVGIAILASVLTSRTSSHVSDALQSAAPAARAAAAHHGTLLAFHDTFLVAAVVTVVAGFIALLIHDSDAAATMVQTPATTAEPAPVAVAAD